MGDRKVLTGWDGKPLTTKGGEPLYEDMYDDFGSEHTQAMAEEMYKEFEADWKSKGKTATK